jgi:nucleotide-binding universal stress UspA family protein
LKLSPRAATCASDELNILYLSIAAALVAYIQLSIYHKSIIMNFIVPVDFSENSTHALEFGLTMANKKQGKITLVHVVESVYDLASQSAVALDGMFQESEQRLKEYVEKYKSEEIEIDFEILEGNPAINVAKIASERDANLIIMGMQGKGGIKKVLIGSTAIDIIREASRPVLVIPIQAKAPGIKKVTLALEFANHEEQFIDWIVAMAKRWDLALEILHIQTNQDFREELAVLGMAGYLEKKYPGEAIKIHTFYASSASEGLEMYMEENTNMILVMCHQHRNLWDQIIRKSQTVELAYHTDVPLLIMR